MEKFGTEKIEALLESVKEIVLVAKKVKEDGKVDVADLAYVVPLLTKLPEMIENFKALGEAFEEIRDIDVAEVISLIQKISALVKEIEKV